MPIPSFNSDGVLPPYHGSAPGLSLQNRSPYHTNVLELCERFGDSSHYRQILKGFLKMRSLLLQLEIHGFQWVDGRFLEDPAMHQKEPPETIRVITFYRPSSNLTDPRYAKIFKPLINVQETRACFHVDHNIVSLKWPGEEIAAYSNLYSGILSHQDDTGAWKGFVRIELNTPTIDSEASQYLAGKERRR